MSVPKWAIHRRAFLRGLGATISLPFLEAMLPYSKAYARAANLPPRMIYLWFDLGVYRTDWVPMGSGNSWSLPSALSPLAPFKNDIIMLRRVRNYYGDSHNEGGGGHARSIGTFLTCAHARYGLGHPGPDFGLPSPSTARLSHQGSQDTAGFAAFQASAYANKIDGSVDQLASKMAWNNNYPIKSIQVRNGGGGDSHHNTINQHLSWSGYNSPAPRYQNLQSLFDAIYAKAPDSTNPVDPRVSEIEKSILDTVGPSVAQINKKVGAADKQRLEKYLDEIRDIERSLANVGGSDGPACSLTPVDRPVNGDPRFDKAIRTTLRLLVKAFECDLTRIATHGWHYGSFSFLRDAQGRSLSKEPHNFYSHHGDNAETRAGLWRISQFWAELFAEFLQQMKEAQDVSGSLLDNSQILFGCGMMDGNSHNSERGNAELPIILAGRAKGQWTPGRVIDTGREIRLADIHLNMLRNMGASATSFGDSVGESLNL